MGRNNETDLRVVKAGRVAELGRYPDERLAAAVAKYGISVENLAAGERYSMIMAIWEWEVATGNRVIELTKRVENLSERPEVIALRNLSLLMMENKQLSERHRELLAESYPIASYALRKMLLEEGFGEAEIGAAELNRALMWG